MKHLVTSLNIKDPDGFYASLIEAHCGLSDEESASLNSRLILLLANHIGDESILLEALAIASPSNRVIKNKSS